VYSKKPAIKINSIQTFTNCCFIIALLSWFLFPSLIYKTKWLTGSLEQSSLNIKVVSKYRSGIVTSLLFLLHWFKCKSWAC